MDEDRLKGMGRQATGSIKEAIGKVTGDKQTEAEGTAEKTGGKVQETVGNAKDTVRDVFKK